MPLYFLLTFYLKWFLPVVLKLLQVVLGAAAGVAHPAEPVREELPDVCDPVIVEAVHHPLDHLQYSTVQYSTVHHPLDHPPRLLRLAHVRVAGQHRLLGPRTFRHGAGSVPTVECKCV